MNFINHYLVMNNHAKGLDAWIVEFLSVKMEKSFKEWYQVVHLTT